MAGLDPNTPVPTEITLLSASKLLEIHFDDGRQFSLSYEFLRVHSPSAAVRGHGVGQETLQQGKRAVDIVELQPVGNYAIRPVFSDGHNSGLYSWDYLYHLGVNHDRLWQDYLERLRAVNGSRDATELPSPTAGPVRSCGHQH